MEKVHVPSMVQAERYHSKGDEWEICLTLYEGNPVYNVKVCIGETVQEAKEDDPKFVHLVRCAMDRFLKKDLEQFVEIYNSLNKESIFFDYAKSIKEEYLKDITEGLSILNEQKAILDSISD